MEVKILLLHKEIRLQVPFIVWTFLMGIKIQHKDFPYMSSKHKFHMKFNENNSEDNIWSQVYWDTLY